jgi:trigger factor
VTYPSNFRTEELRDQETTWHVTLKEIQRRRIPELDEEFARTVGGVDRVEAYRDKVRADLEARFRELDEMTFEAQIMNKLLESSRIVFPDILVQEEVDGRLDRLQRDLQRKRSNLQTYAASKGVTPGEIVKEIHDEAEEDLRRYLLIHQIASQEGILVSPEEVSARIEMDGLSRGARPTIIKIEQTNETKQNETTFVLLKERVMALVRDNAKITEIQSEGTAGPA